MAKVQIKSEKLTPFGAQAEFPVHGFFEKC